MRRKDPKMKNQKIAAVLTLAILLITSQTLLAQPKMEKQGPRGQGKQFKAELNLTDDQEKQMQDLRLDLEKKMIPLEAELKTKNLEMKELHMADTPNKKKMMAQIDKISETKVKMEKAKLEHRLQVREILTPEQQKIFAQQKKHHKRSGDESKCDRPRRGGRF
jgi:Spy/CpxP family protein refolding chaperone